MLRALRQCIAGAALACATGSAWSLDLLSAARLNVEHMENRVFRGGEAAVASIDVAGPVPDELLEQIGAGSEVLGVSAAQFAGTE